MKRRQCTKFGGPEFKDRYTGSFESSFESLHLLHVFVHVFVLQKKQYYSNDAVYVISELRERKVAGTSSIFNQPFEKPPNLHAVKPQLFPCCTRFRSRLISVMHYP